VPYKEAEMNKYKKLASNTLIFAIGTLLYNQVDAILSAKINFFFEMCK
jgi:hypothetical protein